MAKGLSAVDATKLQSVRFGVGWRGPEPGDRADKERNTVHRDGDADQTVLGSEEREAVPGPGRIRHWFPFCLSRG